MKNKLFIYTILMLALWLPGSAFAQPTLPPDTLEVHISLSADSTGTFDTLRQSALFLQVQGTIWDSLYSAQDPHITYRWTLVSRTTADTLFDSITHLNAPNHYKLQLYPLEDDDYYVFVTIPDEDYNRITVYPDTLAFSVRTTRVPLAINSWQMLSLARQTTASDVADLFAGENFWCYHWHEEKGESNGNYVDYTNRTFILGYAYWVRIENDATVLMNLTNSTVDSSGTFTLSLLEGWNQIANPFGYTVAWDSAYFFTTGGARLKMGPSLSTDKPRGLFSWNADAGSYTLHDPSGDHTVALMEPWQGYWVYADTASTLYIPPQPFFKMLHPTATLLQKEAEDTPADAWEITLAASQNSAYDQCCMLGMQHNAHTEYGPEDILKPAPMDPVVALNLAHGMARDIRPLTATQSWDVRVLTSPSEPVHLTWHNIATVPQSYALYLYNAATDETINMRECEEYVLTKTNTPLSIIASTHPHFNPHVVSTQCAITQVYPAPFSDNITISFTLPTDALATTITLTVYGTDGRLIATRTTEGSTGHISWDGLHDGGILLANGTYPYILTIGTTQLTGLLLKTH